LSDRSACAISEEIERLRLLYLRGAMGLREYFEGRVRLEIEYENLREEEVRREASGTRSLSTRRTSGSC